MNNEELRGLTEWYVAKKKKNAQACSLSEHQEIDAAINVVAAATPVKSWTVSEGFHCQCPIRPSKLDSVLVPQTEFPVCLSGQLGNFSRLSWQSLLDGWMGGWVGG